MANRTSGGGKAHVTGGAGANGAGRANGANGATSRPLERPVAIVGARLIDGTGGEPIEDGTLLIEGERITAIGRRDQVRVPRDAAVIDGAGTSVLPGLIDCHVHLASPWGFNLLLRLQTPPALNLLYAVP